MKAPDQIDEMIEKEARDHDGYARQAQSSVDFHTKAAKKLRRRLGCDHEPEPLGESSLFYRCRQCGYQWKETQK